jgi:hypothetical protein
MSQQRSPADGGRDKSEHQKRRSAQYLNQGFLIIRRLLKGERAEASGAWQATNFRQKNDDERHTPAKTT